MQNRKLPAALLFWIVVAQSAAGAPSPKNVIFFIGDGMGFEHVTAAGYYTGGTLSFQTFPYQGAVTTFSADSAVTDSAAAGTALATGYKVSNGVVSTAIPGDGSELQTLVEYSQNRGKATGLVTTTTMTHATPACFGAHEPSRNNTAQIAGDYLSQTRPNVLFGGGAYGMTVPSAVAAGYTVVTTASDMLGLDTSTEMMVSGQFGSTHLPYEYDGVGTLPHLSEMASTALDILDNDQEGFFLMVEGGRIDHAAHAHDIQRDIHETIEFANAVQVAVDWAVGRSDTLILVTADHETGGLSVLQDNGPGAYPTVAWTTSGHTGVNVPVYAWGANAELVTGVLDNTDMFNIVTIPEPGTAVLLLLGGIVALSCRPSPAT